MDWTPENIYLLRRHLGDTQEQFAARVGSKRRYTVTEWESGRRNPGGAVRKLLDIIAGEAGFTERVAARLKQQLEKDE
jgi:DNA-binding transcriptional regulator YiaG